MSFQIIKSLERNDQRLQFIRSSLYATATARYDADEVCEAAVNHVISDFVTGQIPSENDIKDLCTSSCRRLVSGVSSACDDHVSYSMMYAKIAKL